MIKNNGNTKAKYIFITGGVVSGLGKGITAASLGRLLRSRGYKVGVQKLDPYLNVDPGTMSPYQHGEVFVTDDGAETDLDLGHYERFLDTNFDRSCNFTTGKIYSMLLEKERKGEFLGGTVQIIPHVTNEIKDCMRAVARDNDFVIVEIGGTVGDIEGAVYIEAIRQFRKELGVGNSLSIHVTLIPYLEMSGEIKTKPTQSSVRELQQLGVFADILVCRTNHDIELSDEIKDKIAMFCSLDSSQNVICNRNCPSIYEVPLMFAKQKFDEIVLAKFGMPIGELKIDEWEMMVKKSECDKLHEVTVAIVGKYVDVPDAYISVTESLKHSGFANNVKVNVKLIDSEEVEKIGAEKAINGVDGIVVPGGFGNRGIEGKIATARYARERNLPYLGLCLGMQVAVIEFARNVCGLNEATSTEFNGETSCPVIDIMEAQKNVKMLGATMRLGLFDCELKEGTTAHKLYGKDKIKERHRHRYELNNEFREKLTKNGLIISGINKELDLVEIIELNNHPFFIASQFHPEFLSRPNRPHPLFDGFIKAASTKN
ncbi:MAG: CTP synthase [Christensenellaceae bacterium]|nr:CTP synthase [Christensenellaceae bacterium]